MLYQASLAYTGACQIANVGNQSAYMYFVIPVMQQPATIQTDIEFRIATLDFLTRLAYTAPPNAPHDGPNIYFLLKIYWNVFEYYLFSSNVLAQFFLYYIGNINCLALWSVVYFILFFNRTIKCYFASVPKWKLFIETAILRIKITKPKPDYFKFQKRNKN